VCGSNVIGDYTVTATYGLLTDTATLHVTPATLDHIVISPADATIEVGQTQTYTAHGFDAFDNPIGTVTDQTTFSIDAPGSCTGADCGATQPGDYTVTGTDGSLTDTAALHVTAATLDHIVISPADTTIQSGQTQSYTAEGFDVSDNSLGDVTSETVFSIDSPGSCTGAVCGATQPGDYTVTGTDGSFTDTTTLHVAALPGPHITGFSPARSRTRAWITITGTGFTGTTVVTFNAHAASFHVDSDSQISARVPNAATTGRIRVWTPEGSTASAALFIVLPHISGFSPSWGWVGATVSIRGSGFSKVKWVKVGGVAARFQVRSSRLLIVRIPKGARTQRIAVRTAYGIAKSSKKLRLV
jgi:hypothetical protein